MSRRKRTEITVKARRRVIVGRRGGSHRAWCESCRKQVEMITAEDAAASVGVSRRTIYALVEADKLHFSETPGGRVFICLNSLSERFGKEEKHHEIQL